MKTLIVSMIVLAMNTSSVFAGTVGPHVYELCKSKKWPSWTKSAEAGMIMEKQMKGKTLVLYEEAPDGYHEGLFPMRISAKKTSKDCVEFTVVTADLAYNPGTGGSDLEIEMSEHWIDFSIGDDGRSHYMMMYQGDFEAEENICDKNTKGKYVNGGLVGTAIHEWSSRVDSHPFNGCFE